ncbi:hypothetical protein H310_08240 [Aphanomyces invadans]|uniref:Uncharacterized protein n=1 Tax=Aphanomyces invadans TaxID=157072 RepID=A0A024U1V0_9STRA|nr:hypothetical protein H310_08240 [Aphanomyces invadans]ETV99587.1 hypothetical protein H310_08240 [Aphanomyces invadans]|eukprot:XP_008872143.1 hypothetical protein H310_08240 [Aphanomyces invadans]
MSPSIQSAATVDKLGDPIAPTEAVPVHPHSDNTYHIHAGAIPAAVPVVPATPCPCCNPANKNNTIPQASSRSVTYRSPFVFSGIVGFAGVALVKNLFFLTSTVGVTALTLMALGKQGIVEVDWKKLESKLHIPQNTDWTIQIPSKAGLVAGMFAAWKFFA